MSGGESINISTPQDLNMVQHRVERCLQHYMHKREAMSSLAMNDNIDPVITELIWQRLEEQNPDFFKAYYLKLLVKDQIVEFNRLLSEQVELMSRIGIEGGPAPVILTSNGSHVSPLQPLPTQSSRIHKAEGNNFIQQQQENIISRASVHPSTTVQATFDGSVPPSLFFPQNPNVGFAESSNGHIPRGEAHYDAGLRFNFSSPHGHHLMEPPRPTMIGDACMSSFSGGVDDDASNIHHHVNGGSLLSGEGSSFGFLPLIPSHLSFSELAAADFPDLLGSYSRPTHFMAPEANGFADPKGK